MNTERAICGFMALCGLTLAIAHSFRGDWLTVTFSLAGMGAAVALGTIKDEVER